MDTENGTKPAFFLGWLYAPIAVLLAIAAIKVNISDFAFDMNTLAPMLVVTVAAIGATLPRVLRENGTVDASNGILSLVTLVVAFAAAELITSYTSLGGVTALVFAVVLFFGHIFDIKGRHEGTVVLAFAGIGFFASLVLAGDAAAALPQTFQINGEQLVSTQNLHHQAVGYVFFSYFTIFALLGVLVAVLGRGVLSPAGDSGWWGYLGESEGAYNRNTMGLQIALLVWILAHVASLWHFGDVSVADKLGVTQEDGYHGHFGFWSAFFTGIVALFVAGMAAEKWNTRAMTLGSMWALYQVSSWYEAGMWSNEAFEGSWGALLWLAATFFIGVAIYMISTHENFGGWANRDDHNPSAARQFWSDNWAGIMVGAAFFFGLVIRVQWYVVPSMNAFGTGNWDMTGGSDPWYMKRVVDYIIANNAHLIYDADRFYPVGGINPRPPLFSWSMAIGAMILSPLLGISAGDAVWWSMLGLPAIYGALTILPIAAIAKDHVGKGAGVIAAWLIAFMPAHVTHSTWALADHDAFVMLFISIGFLFWLRAVKFAGSERLTKSISPSPADLFKAFSDVATHRKAALANAILAGVAFGVASLGWKGFIVGPAILFIAYFVQVALNMFRRRDSTTINTLFLAMLFVNLLMAVPFYAHPQLDLLFDGTGLQPFLFVLVFTLAITFVTSGFRDKPWVLVLGTLAVSGAVFFGLLYVLKFLEISNAFDVLVTGSGYFTKTKIFGTVAEANAPDRGQLFASFGPIVFVLSLVMGILLAWEGLRKRKQTSVVFAVWIIAASFMAWSAARFMFNATPAVAVLGAWGIVSLWNWASFDSLKRNWRKFGIRTPADRIAGARRAVWRTPQFSAIFLVMMMVFGQQATFGLDAAVPGTVDAERELDEDIYYMMPDILRWDDLLGVSLLDSSPHDGRWYLGSFGSGFNDDGWNRAYEWLAAQDTDMEYSQRPAFVSWWDYGFQALNTGEHPSVSDNFQSGIPAAGNMLLARSQEDLVSMFIWQLAEGDISYTNSRTGNYVLSDSFQSIMDKHLSDAQFDEFVQIETDVDIVAMSEFVESHSFKVIKTNRNVVMAQGYHNNEGVFDNNDLVYRLYVDGEQLECTAELSGFCDGSDWSDIHEANRTFANNIRSGQDTVEETTHYIIGDYWYTSDLVDEFDSVSTNIHRKNARLALTVQLLTNALEPAEIIDLYDDIIGMEGGYTVQAYEGLPGETVTRDHEIRYFAVDDRLYPRAGRYTADYQYNYGQPMGIFGAPTILSGQDIATYMDEVYETVRGEFQDEMTREEVDEAMKQDFLNQQAGADIDLLQVQDVRVDHTAAFFNTMVARAYVGYGASTLGVDTSAANPQPAQNFRVGGSPGSVLQQALPLPGAMMNHFVIANWYDDGENIPAGNSNTDVKVLKYYSGAELSGQVSMSDDGQGLPNVRILLERDAFSGEGTEDLDQDTYWIPIGFTDADENGHWSYTVPAGRIRVSAFAGDYNPTDAQDDIRTGAYTDGLIDLLTETEGERDINAISAILGNVANMTWMGDNQMNVTADQADRISDITESLDIEIDSSGVSGTITWSGDDSFAGEPLVDMDFILRNIWSMTDNYTITTTTGSFSSDESRILQGTGQVTFTSEGTFESEGMAFAQDFTGEFTRALADGRVFSDNGTWTGSGTLEASWVDATDVVDCTIENDTNDAVMPANETLCSVSTDGDITTYLLAGEVEANGRFTSDGVSTMTKTLTSATFEGAGKFVGTGTLEGTGLFIGAGDFSGEMVKPGSFYQTGLVPGMYNVIAQLDNGKEVLLPDPVEIGLEPTYDLELTLPGSIFNGTLKDMMGEVLDNHTIELVDVDLGEDHMVIIETDENGTYSYGPITKGDYFYRVDLDGDGWYEMNETMSVNDDSANFSVAYDVPPMVDLAITLGAPAESGLDLTGRTVTFTNDDPILPPISSESDENGVVYVELPPGSYTISDDNDESFVLFSYVTLEVDEDQDLELDYAVAVNTTGTIRTIAGGVDYDEWLNQPEETRDEATDAASGLTVEFVSGDLSFSTVTDINGTYSLVLPEGHTFHMTTRSLFSAMAGGMLVNTTGGMDELDVLYLAPTVETSGWLFLYDNSSSWDQTIPGWEAVTVTATDETGLEWTTELQPNGDFSIHLLEGAWDFSVAVEALAVDDVVDYNIVRDAGAFPTPVELVANPAAQTVEINVFMNSGNDGEFANGTAVSPAFTIMPSNDHGTQVNVTADDYIAPGIVEVSLTPAAYVIEFDATDAGDENATDYSLLSLSTMDIIPLGLAEVEEAIPVALENKYLMTGHLEQENGSNLTVDFLLWDAEGENWENVASDDDGNFATYVPAGDWIVVVANFLDDDNGTEALRYPVTISDDSSLRTGLDLVTVDNAEVEIHLSEAVTGNNMTDTRITAVSHDGYGNITLDKTSENGTVSEKLVPGTWSFYLNKSGSQRVWSLDTSDAAVTLVGGESTDLTLEASLEVEIGGKVYWDLNNDSEPSMGEGVADFNVTITGGDNNSEFSEVVTTDEDGVWRIYVPLRDVYTVTVEKDGFGTESYNISNSSGYQVNDTPESHDIEVSAGEVTVSGTVTYVNNAAALDGATITLIPSSGVDRDSVDVTGTYDGESLTWSTSVIPGDWIVVVSGSDEDVNGGGIAIAYLDATVAQGAEIDMEMRAGGWVDLSTSWTAIDLEEYHAGSDSNGSSLINEAVVVTVSIGDDVSYDVEVDADGTLALLLPSGDVEFDSEFLTTQHDDALEMEYLAGTSAEVLEGRVAKSLTYNRRINSDTVLTVDVDSISNADVAEEGSTDLIAIESDEAYQVIEFNVDVAYEGTETMEVFTVGGSVDVSPDQADWTVEVLNGSEWVESYELELGVGVDANDDSVTDSATISVRITLPNATDAWHLEEGHSVNIGLTSEAGADSSVSVNVEVPQTYGFTMEDKVENIGIAPNGVNTFSFSLVNDGNGDDSFTIELSNNVPADWSITPDNSVITLAKDDTRSQAFTARAPADFTEGSITVTVTVTSEDGRTLDYFDVEIEAARISLSVDEGDIIEKSNNKADTPGDMIIPVTNSGMLGTDSVQVILVVEATGEEYNTTISVGPQSTADAIFSLPALDAATHRFQVRVDVLGEDADYVEDEVEDFDFQVKFQISDETPEESGWFTALVAGFLILIAFFGLRFIFSSRSSKF